ncbi:hypothetical protein H4F85_28230, partial [Citrobacter braakii]|nr:hypothetical protein [Citrobacter braakii]
EEIEGWVGYNFPGRGDKYSSMKYPWYHFSGVDWDDSRKKNAIYKIVGPDKGWAPDVSDENGNQPIACEMVWAWVGKKPRDATAAPR